MNVQLETVIATAIAIIGSTIGVAGWMRTGKQYTQQETKLITGIEVKLDLMSDTLAEIKSSVQILSKQVSDLSKDTVEVQSEVKNLWKTVDDHGDRLCCLEQRITQTNTR